MSLLEKQLNKVLFERRDVYFHGTTGQNIKTILTQGFIPEPKHPTTPNAELGTVYFSKDPNIALNYADIASGGDNKNLGIIVTQIETRTSVPDEDVIFRDIRDIQKKNNSSEQIAQILLNKYPIHQSLHERFKQLLKAFLEFQNQDHTKDDGETYAKAYDENRNRLHQLSTMLKQYSDKVSNIRVHAPVTFRGANKIIGAISTSPEGIHTSGYVPPQLITLLNNVREAGNSESE